MSSPKSRRRTSGTGLSERELAEQGSVVQVLAAQDSHPPVDGEVPVVGADPQGVAGDDLIGDRPRNPGCGGDVEAAGDPAVRPCPRFDLVQGPVGWPLDLSYDPPPFVVAGSGPDGEQRVDPPSPRWDV